MSRNRRARSRIAHPIWVPAAVTALLLTGCTDEQAAVALPTADSPPFPSPSTSQSNVKAIKHSYTEFVGILDRADSLPASTREQELSIHMAGPQLSEVLDRIKEMKKNNLTTYGKVTVHIESVQVDGRDAVVRDCQDTSSSGIKNSVTGKKINRGIKKEGIKAYLLKGPDGRWRVTKMVSLGEGC